MTQPQAFEVIIKARDLSINRVIDLPGITWQVQRYGFDAKWFGCDQASLIATGETVALWELLNTLRCEVLIKHLQTNRVVWWGYIRAVTLVAGAISIRSTLQEMANSVTVAYRDGATEFETAPATDQGSIDTYSRKELRLSQFGITGDTANAVRDATLEQKKAPQLVPTIAPGSSQRPRATLECRGWGHVTQWRYYSVAGDTASINRDITHNLALGWQLDDSDMFADSTTNTLAFLNEPVTAIAADDLIRFTSGANSGDIVRVVDTIGGNVRNVSTTATVFRSVLAPSGFRPEVNQWSTFDADVIDPSQATLEDFGAVAQTYDDDYFGNPWGAALTLPSSETTTPNREDCSLLLPYYNRVGDYEHVTIEIPAAWAGFYDIFGGREPATITRLRVFTTKTANSNTPPGSGGLTGSTIAYSLGSAYYAGSIQVIEASSTYTYTEGLDYEILFDVDSAGWYLYLAPASGDFVPATNYQYDWDDLSGALTVTTDYAYNTSTNELELIPGTGFTAGDTLYVDYIYFRREPTTMSFAAFSTFYGIPGTTAQDVASITQAPATGRWSGATGFPGGAVPTVAIYETDFSAEIQGFSRSGNQLSLTPASDGSTGTDYYILWLQYANAFIAGSRNDFEDFIVGELVRVIQGIYTVYTQITEVSALGTTLTVRDAVPPVTGGTVAVRATTTYTLEEGTELSENNSIDTTSYTAESPQHILSRITPASNIRAATVRLPLRRLGAFLSDEQLTISLQLGSQRLAVAYVGYASLPDEMTEITIPFETAASLAASTTYRVIISRTGAANDNLGWFQIGVNTGGGNARAGFADDDSDTFNTVVLDTWYSLTRYQVLVDTIAVSVGATVYTFGEDYEYQESGGDFQIRFLSTGTISAGANVDVDYEYITWHNDYAFEVPIVLQDSIETTSQLDTILTSSALSDIINSSTLSDASGLFSFPEQDGSSTAYAVLSALLEHGTTNKRRMNLFIDEFRDADISEELAPDTSTDTFIDAKGTLREGLVRTEVPRWLCPYARWVRLEDWKPLQVGFDEVQITAVQYLQGAEYDPATDTLRYIWRNEPGPWDVMGE